MSVDCRTLLLFAWFTIFAAAQQMSKNEEEMAMKNDRKQWCVATDIDGVRLINLPILKGENITVNTKVYDVSGCIQKCVLMEPVCPFLVHRTFPNRATRCEVEGEIEDPNFRPPAIQEGERRLHIEFRKHCHRWITEDYIYPVDYWNGWTEWTPCSATCLGGFRTRQRTCRPDTIHEVYRPDTACASLERERCNRMSCEEAAEMPSKNMKRFKLLPFMMHGKRLTAQVKRTINHRVTGVNYCVKACNILGPACQAVSYRKYLEKRLAPECVIYSEDMTMGAHLVNVPSSEEWMTVQFLDTRNLKEWSDWGECSVSCGDGTMVRTREGNGTIGGKHVEFKYERNQICYGPPCWDEQ